MSIQSEINRINNNVQSTLNTIADTGVAVGASSDALPAAAAALANEKMSASVYDPTGKKQDVFAHSDTKANTVYNKIISRGQQLIVNGNGFLGDNTNFSNFDFDGSQSNGSPGSFTKPRGVGGVHRLDEFIPIDPNKTYVLTCDMMSATASGINETNFYMYDVDGLEIRSYNKNCIAGTLTTLTQDVVKGDTVVHVESLSGWSYSTYRTHIGVWNYKNSFGYQYEPETYTRNFIEICPMFNTIPEGTFDFNNNVIHLSSAYSGATIPAGTLVSQFYYVHATSAYPVSGTTPTTWTHYKGTFGANGSQKWFPGTAFVQLNLYWNYQNHDDQVWGTNFSFTEQVGDVTTSAMNTAISNATKNFVTTSTMNSAISNATSSCVTETEMSEAISVAIGSIDAVLDTINGEVV